MTFCSLSRCENCTRVLLPFPEKRLCTFEKTDQILIKNADTDKEHKSAPPPPPISFPTCSASLEFAFTEALQRNYFYTELMLLRSFKKETYYLQSYKCILTSLFKAPAHFQLGIVKDTLDTHRWPATQANKTHEISRGRGNLKS